MALVSDRRLRSVYSLLLALLTGCQVSPLGGVPGVGSVAEEVERHAEVAEEGDKDSGTPPPVDRPESEAEAAFQEVLEGMGVRYLPARKTLEVDGWVNMQKGLVEVFACAPEGKTHESVVVLDCVPSGLHAGLIALGLKAGTPVVVGTDGEYTAPTGDPVLIHIRWRGPEGKQHTARAEDWVWNQNEGRSMKRTPWLFTGSFLQPVPGDPGEATYAANSIKSLVTTYYDASTILENALPLGQDDTVYYANDKAVPPVRTPITAIFEAGKK